jgi:hypothetical protein
MDELPEPRQGNLPQETPGQLADKLIEKRERLLYFIVTASTAVIAFTFNNLSSSAGILHAAPAWLPISGWALLLLAAGAALYLIRRRHKEYFRYIDELYGRRPSPSEIEVMAFRKLVARFELLMMSLFLVGVLLLVIAYAIALAKN